MSRKIMLLSALTMLLFACAAGAEEREISLKTEVPKWGQMPVRFEIRNQALPEGVTAADFHITGKAEAWGTPSQHPFSCGVAAVEATGDGWALMPERFPDKFFYVKQMEVACEAHPELGFTLADVGEITTQTADDFTLVENYESRLSAHVYDPGAAEPLPLVLVFHGYGDTSNLLTYRTAVAWAEPERQAAHPCVVMAPTIDSIYYTSEIARSRIYEGIMGQIDAWIAAGKVDPNRLYVMGNSFGGMASFEIAEAYPDRFAAILALCPALNYSARGTVGLSALTDIPVTIAQAEHDETIPVEVGRGAAEALTAAGNDRVTLRIYTDEEMNACGAAHGREQTYSFHHVELAVMEDAAYADWLFSQARG